MDISSSKVVVSSLKSGDIVQLASGQSLVRITCITLMERGYINVCAKKKFGNDKNEFIEYSKMFKSNEMIEKLHI